MSGTAGATLRIDGRDERPLDTAGAMTLADAIGRSGVTLDMRCGGQGRCHGCEVEADGVVVQACQCQADGVWAVNVLPRSVLRPDAHVAAEYAVRICPSRRPLGRASGDDPIREPLALAIDVGTTTVAALLIDRTTGAIIARAGDLNGQASFGDNVLARIQHAMHDRSSVEQMRVAVLNDTIGPVVRRLLGSAGRSSREIAVAAVAGNTTMLHLLVGEDPSSLGVAPFETRFIGHRVEPLVTAWAGVEGLAPEVHLLPGVSAYIGADIVAGVVAVALDRSPGPALFLDIGTNGEMVLFDGERLTACATAAGPAFEGVGLTCGVRAGERAISAVRVCADPASIIGVTMRGCEREPVGLCGTAYVDLLAAGRENGLLDEWGRLTPGGYARWSDSIVASDHGGKGLRLSPEHGSWRDERYALVTERDLATVIQAKAAIRAGAEVLLERAGVRARDLHAIYVAGGFGTRLVAGNAIAIGLLPEVAFDRVVPVGNTSLAGAAAAVLNVDCLAHMNRWATRIEPHVLGHGDDFEARFLDAMRLPDAT